MRVTLANYFAAALMMPYGKFHEAAELSGYDLDVLGAKFGASYEQVAHRLTTLGRSTARGIPFFMLRVDGAGNVSKRLASGRFPFAQFGGTCALWNLHSRLRRAGQDFDAGDRTDRQFPLVFDRPHCASGGDALWRDRARIILSASVARCATRAVSSMPNGSISMRSRRRRSGSIAGSASVPPVRNVPRRRRCARCMSMNRCAGLRRSLFGIFDRGFVN